MKIPKAFAYTLDWDVRRRRPLFRASEHTMSNFVAFFPFFVWLCFLGLFFFSHFALSLSFSCALAHIHSCNVFNIQHLALNWYKYLLQKSFLHVVVLFTSSADIVAWSTVDTFSFCCCCHPPLLVFVVFVFKHLQIAMIQKYSLFLLARTNRKYTRRHPLTRSLHPLKKLGIIQFTILNSSSTQQEVECKAILVFESLFYLWFALVHSIYETNANGSESTK